MIALPMCPEEMTSAQRVRRRKATSAVIDMLADTTPDRIQMREVSERSGVAMGTLYRYFPTKQHLLAVAMLDWNERLGERLAQERLNPSSGAEDRGALPRVLSLYRRQMRAYERGPNFARLDIELQTSTDLYVRESLDVRAAANRSALFAEMIGVPPELARLVTLSVGSTMLNSLVLWTTGRISFAEAMRNVEDVCGLVLAGYP